METKPWIEEEYKDRFSTSRLVVLISVIKKGKMNQPSVVTSQNLILTEELIKNDWTMTIYQIMVSPSALRRGGPRRRLERRRQKWAPRGREGRVRADSEWTKAAPSTTPAP
ncbi:hypothetical protein LAZ67_2001379 [Cordylochernes scorpioides]|uniref:Uncharacterized protein n=1 Tax=Cordylochernes scorpioides TaxID=51811 RepID=A0ABY6K163_9ARAC|nr:hypothetical protein LAZ67_2001379 [Cordylochernes scorpioides]